MMILASRPRKSLFGLTPGVDGVFHLPVLNVLYLLYKVAPCAAMVFRAAVCGIISDVSSKRDHFGISQGRGRKVRSCRRLDLHRLIALRIIFLR